MVAASALANKMARGIWAMLTRGEDYRGPALGARLIGGRFDDRRVVRKT